ncbi:hypothetical protein DFH27DRAFT_605936 [Peziza echinospora]|nr:hypothetical protein DFH27DRAFT_605936 [Peziza echinospora]
MSTHTQDGAGTRKGSHENQVGKLGGKGQGQTQTRKRRVAVIGSGLAGLTTAYLLDKSNFDVEIFEAGPQPSLDGASVSIPISEPKNGEEPIFERIDVPMRAFAGGYYTALMSMYRFFDIPFRSQQFLFMFSRELAPDGEEDGSAYFIHSSNNHRIPPIKPAGQTWPKYIKELLYLWLIYSYFTLCCFLWPPRTRAFNSSVTGGSSGETESLREYIARIHLPQYFTENYLLPLMSSVTTCPHQALLDFPASDIAGYKKGMHKQPHYMIEGGVSQIQAKLLTGGEVKLYTGRKVVKVQRIPRRGGVIVCWSQQKDLVNTDGSGDDAIIYEKMFDQVVLAVSPDVVAKIYERLEEDMGRIPCCEAEVIVHYDGRVIEDVLSRVEASDNDTQKCERGGDSGDEGQSLEKEYISTTTSSTAFRNKSLTSLLRTNTKILTGSSAHTIQLRTTTKKSASFQTINSLITESTHIHPPGVLLTTTALRPIAPEKVLGESRFVRVLRTPESRDIVGKLLSPRRYQDNKSPNQAGDAEWKNGDEGVWLVGGWCWDGMVLLEGCVRSAVNVARGLGAKVPWEDGYQDGESEDEDEKGKVDDE